MTSPCSLPLQMPLKETTAPVSVRPFASCAISRAASKSASWIRMLAIAVILVLAAGHRREEGGLARAGNRRLRPDMNLVDRGADHFWGLERVRIGLAAAREPGDEFADGADGRRRI